MEANKIIGYVLLLAGLLLILVPLFQTYQIFTGKSLPPQVFKTETVTANPNAGFDLQKQMQNAFIAILPLALINNTLNLLGWLTLMVILMFGGGQLANIGIKLIKT
jgi:hypothetical protein